MPHLLFLVVGLMAVSSLGCGGSSGSVAVPKWFTKYNSADGTFAVRYPEGWEADGKAGKRVAWARFESGGAKISVRADAKASLMDDAAGGRAADREAPSPEYAPVHNIHEMGLDRAPDEYGDYQETPAGTQVLDCPLGPARFSEFTGTAGFAGSIHGYRATVIGHKMGVHVICICPESDWAVMKPAFDHVLGTLARGQVE